MKSFILLIIVITISTIFYKDGLLSLHDYSFSLLGFVGMYFVKLNYDWIKEL
jgi:hypothetical protein